uniref:AAA+ ATPase domain-containing protein n=1 Tax=Kalanchoe fedtschenkoi TaxID=63787 RepID=A0A7N0R9G2_KALFE
MPASSFSMAGFSRLGESWAELGSALAGLMFMHAMLQQYMPTWFLSYLSSLTKKLLNYSNSKVQISVSEFSGDRMNKRNQLYLDIEIYLSGLASAHARRLKADMSNKSKTPVFSMDDQQEVTDEFQGVKVRWISKKENRRRSNSLNNDSTPDETRFYELVVHENERGKFAESYLLHVREKAQEISARNRQRKLYSNKSGGYHSLWTDVIFDHPASFEKLAMDPIKKREIMNDLKKFSSSKDYYAKIGQAWKRGYLLYGPPGTGKSTMIACIANYLGYDVYFLELTAVKNNSQLRELIMETSSKSVIVIEDIDCSLNLTGQRRKLSSKDPVKKKKEDEDKEVSNSNVTLSGLLNSIDGLWSHCGSEKIIVFTTNHLEDLDPALIRTGRMDKHIKMSYCCFEAFKELAKIYLDTESHVLFDDVKALLNEVNMTPAVVAENLKPKCAEDDADTCLKKLVGALQEARGKAVDEVEVKDVKAEPKLIAPMKVMKKLMSKLKLKHKKAEK